MEAYTSREQCKIIFNSCKVTEIGRNRRLIMKDGTIKMIWDEFDDDILINRYVAVEKIVNQTSKLLESL